MVFAMQTQHAAQRCLGGSRRPFQRPAGGHKPNRLLTRYTSDNGGGITGESYMVLGLSNCFQKNEEGKLVDTLVIEPLSAPALECMAAGARTSFRHVTGVTYEAALSKAKEELPAEFETGIFCDKFEYRCDAAARTWQRNHAQDNLMDLVPLGAVRSNFNFDLTDKRVLNIENVVTDDDNIKQDISIDVYGRKAEEETVPAPVATAVTAVQEEEEKEEEDDLDSLLMA